MVPPGAPTPRTKPTANHRTLAPGPGWVRARAGPGRVGRGNSEDLEAAHRAEPLGELAIVKPAPMPGVAVADHCIEDDRERHDDFGDCEIDFEVWRHERAEPEADRDPAKHESE